MSAVMTGTKGEVDRANAFVGYSEVSCEDLNPNCDDWAAHGECDKNPDFMHVSCRPACHICQVGGPSRVVPDLTKADRVALVTKRGPINIILYRELSPKTADLVLGLAAKGHCSSCRFYRNEAKPPPGSLGPPYGLLQGSLGGLSEAPPKEGGVSTRAGHVVFIPGTKEFFIAVSDHKEWGATAHSVWGEVDADDWHVVEEILTNEFHEFKHPDFGTVMRMMNEEEFFKLQVPHPREQDAPLSR